MSDNLDSHPGTESYRERKLAAGGMLAASFAAMLMLASESSLSCWLIVATCALSAAIPLLALVLWLEVIKHDAGWRVGSLVEIGGLVAAWMGISIITFHMSVFSGAIFVVATVSVILLGAAYNHAEERKYRELAKAASSQEPSGPASQSLPPPPSPPPTPLSPT